MDLSLNEEQLLIQDTARDFANAVLAPAADKVEHDRPLFLSNLKALADLGFMGLNVNAKYGGTEAGVVAFSLVITEVAKVCASTAVTLSVNNMVAEVIEVVASDQQKADYIPRLCGGTYPAAGFCLTEAGAGSDPASMRTSATRDGDDWLLNGSKLYITSAEYAGIFVVWAVTDSSVKKGKGISCFLVQADTPGIHVSKAERKLGQHASSTNEVVFDNCRIPGNGLMGGENQGFRIAVGELTGGRIGIASLALGLGLAAIDYAKRFVQERHQFGQAIADFQGIQWMLADTYTELEAARLLVMNAAYCKESGKAYAVQASMAKLFASEKANTACNTALQLLGGAGYLEDHPIARFTRDARITTIYEGTSQIQKIIIAKQLLAG
jgi:alkylation response protein AidB-like acyl-CoA dehydrogenase